MLKEPSAATEGDRLIFTASLRRGEEEHIPKSEERKGGREAPPGATNVRGINR